MTILNRPICSDKHIQAELKAVHVRLYEINECKGKSMKAHRLTVSFLPSVSAPLRVQEHVYMARLHGADSGAHRRAPGTAGAAE